MSSAELMHFLGRKKFNLLTKDDLHHNLAEIFREFNLKHKAVNRRLMALRPFHPDLSPRENWFGFVKQQEHYVAKVEHWKAVGLRYWNSDFDFDININKELYVYLWFFARRCYLKQIKDGCLRRRLIEIKINSHYIFSKAKDIFRTDFPFRLQLDPDFHVLGFF